MHLTRSEFERLVEEALEQLPPQFARLLDNVAIVVEEEPSEEDLDLLDDDDGDDGDEEPEYEDGGHDHAHGELLDDHGQPGELLGIYRGVALTRRTHDMLPMLPDQIAIFRGPILRIARSRGEAVREVRDTVIHELGHYFGLHDHEMPY